MTESKLLTDLRFGAEACLRNAERLLSDADKLLGENDNISSFLLYLSALEELGKVGILADKIEKGQHITQGEWDKLKWRKGHLKKLREYQKTRDALDSKMVSPFLSNFDFDEALDNMAKQLGSQNIQAHREKRAKELHDLRLAENYVDFHDGKWFEPQPLDKIHVWRAITAVKDATERMKSKVKLHGRKGVEP